jgi:hypothetical protein
MTKATLWAAMFIALFVASSLPFVSPVAAQGYQQGFQPVNATSQTPLMVIRYNQPKVFYQRQLYNAVARAVAIKSDVVFEVVSFIPGSGQSSRDEAATNRAQQQTAALLKDMTGMGIPPQRIRVTRETAADARQHEIYIYVD